MERIDGFKVDQIEEQKAHGIDPKEIALIGLRSFSRQLMEFGFFHADPHPGNVIVAFFSSSETALMALTAGVFITSVGKEDELASAPVRTFRLALQRPRRRLWKLLRSGTTKTCLLSTYPSRSEVKPGRFHGPDRRGDTDRRSGGKRRKIET